MATEGVLLLRGGAGAGPCVERSQLCVERSEPKGRAGYRGGGGVTGGQWGGVGGGGWGGMEGKVWRSTHKAVHTQGSAHTRRFVATARVLLFTGVRGLAPALSKASRL